MATPKPGEIRCPTCHRSTPPAAFCTQCGSAIPSDARIRPRGMDRDELQERIRARRSGSDPYRRGGSVDQDRGDYERFEPDPNDTRARGAGPTGDQRRDHFEEAGASEVAAGPAGGSRPERGDLTRDRDEWSRPAVAPLPGSAPAQAAYTPPPSDVPVDNEPAYVDNYADRYRDDGYDEGEGTYQGYDDWDDGRDRRSGAGAVAILGFLALGVLALMGGAVLAGVFGGDPGVGQGDPSPSASATASASVEASASASAAPSGSDGGATGSPGASGDPVVFPDGFTAEVQPCLPGSADLDGCDSNGAQNGGVVDIWVGFENGTGSDVVGVTLVPPDGGTPIDGSIDLADIDCGQSCNGYTWFPFRNLTPGSYVVNITRNGQPAGSTSFEVS